MLTNDRLVLMTVLDQGGPREPKPLYYHYIFALGFLSSSCSFFLSSPNLRRRRLDVYHTSTHGVALVRI